MRFVILLLLLVGCSINHRSENFVCQNQGDCAPGQNCSDGFCIGTGNPNEDAGPDPDGAKPDTFQCPIQCTSCQLQSVAVDVPAADQLPRRLQLQHPVHP
jgi:hypothetical protein